jgi:hypothetical protein
VVYLITALGSWQKALLVSKVSAEILEQLSESNNHAVDHYLSEQDSIQALRRLRKVLLESQETMSLIVQSNRLVLDEVERQYQLLVTEEG